MVFIHEKLYILVELTTDLMALLKLLDSMDTTVRLRHEKSSTARKNQAEICSIVNALNLGERLTIPLSARVIHSDRPDVVIESATTKVGVEIVETVSETTAAMDCEGARLLTASVFHWAPKQIPGEKSQGGS